MFNIGDCVLLRDDLKAGTTYGIFFCNSDMANLAGSEARITEVIEDPIIGVTYYRINTSCWNFTDEMFLSLSEPELPLDESEFDLSEVLM